MSRARRSGTLYRRIYLHGVLLLVLVAAALGAAGYFFGHGPRWRWHPTLLAQHLAALLAPVPEEDLPAVLAALSQEFDADLAVYSDDARPLAAAGARAPSPLAGAQVSRLHGTGKALRQGPHVASSAAGRERYLRLALRRSEGEMLLRGLGSLAVVVLALAAASAPLARAIARPIDQLGRAARRLGEGDLGARSGLQRGDEIGALARTFDEMAERLERLLEGQRDLLANVSHELRTPLARIRMTLGLAAEAQADAAQRYLREIEQDLAELERLVADVLTAARLDGGGGLVLRREPVNLGSLSAEVIERFRRGHPGREVVARIEPTPAVEAEATLLARVLDNLLDNAAKYSEPSTPIGVALAPGDGVVVLAVSDQGIGLAPEDQARAFTPFFRADRSRTRDTGGVGLGLALSKRIVEAHGGDIVLESAPGKGTTVTVRLPAVVPS